MKALLAPAVATLLLLAGCGGSPESAPTQVPSVVTVSAAPDTEGVPTPGDYFTPTPSSDASDDDVDATLCDLEGNAVRLLSARYVLVDASRGLDDHREMVKNFYEGAKDVSDDVTDACGGDKAVAATGLTLDAAILNAGVIASGEASNKYYKQTVKDGQALFDAFRVTQFKFGDDI